MNKKTLVILSGFLLFGLTFYGQEKPVSVTYEMNLTKDTLVFYVNKTPETKKGTLMVMASADNQADTFYFPVIDSSSLYALTIPKEYALRSLQVQAMFYPQVFAVNGKVVSRKKDHKIKAVVVSKNGKLYNKELNISDSSSFALPGMVFEDKATLVFAYSEVKNNGYPDVWIEQAPKNIQFTDTVFNKTIFFVAPDTSKPKAVTAPAVNLPTAQKPVAKDTSSSFNKVGTLQSVTVEGVRKSRAEKFNEENSTALFNDPSEKILDCLSNDDILKFADCLSFLQSKVPGLSVNLDKFGENVLMWRGHETKAFFIDEIPVDIEQFLAVNVADIAIIKVYPPPFFGSTGGNGDGGGIALYTRTGDDRRPGRGPAKWLFEIKGYSPAIHVLHFNDDKNEE